MMAAAGAYHVIVYLCMNIRLHLTMGDDTSNTIRSLRCYTEKHNDRYRVCDSGVCTSVQTIN